MYTLSAHQASTQPAAVQHHTLSSHSESQATCMTREPPHDEVDTAPKSEHSSREFKEVISYNQEEGDNGGAETQDMEAAKYHCECIAVR